VPAELPFEHLDLPALGGQIGPTPEDFVVDEVPLYRAAGQGRPLVRAARQARAHQLPI
jgi:hypothetical protein